MNLPSVDVRQQFVNFKGGLDEVTPPWEIPSGKVKRSQNVYQDVNGGYWTFQGYESFDGRTAPSSVTYSILDAVITGTVAAGDTLTDGTRTGIVLEVATNYIVLTATSGSFATGNISVGATVVGTCVGPQRINGATTARLRAYYKNIAADYYRSLIAAVPGSGDVLGIHYYNNKWYAFRNNAGGTAAEMYESSSSGWSLVNLGREISFTSGGTYQISVGNTITGATSTAFAVVTKVILVSGTWAGGDAAGRLFFASQTGTFQAESLNVGANLNVATIAGNSTAITLLPAGHYELANYNFTGNSSTLKMYGVDGVNKGFEFDGAIFVKINTGMTTDAPRHMYEHMAQLFYSFGPSVQHSAPGLPYVWSVVVGSGEIGIGDNVTGFSLMPGSTAMGALAIFSENRSSILYGTGVGDWQLVPYKNEVGAIERSIQQIGRTFLATNFGLVDFYTSQNFGNFQDSVISEKIRYFLSTRLGQITASCISRMRNQYWLFFSDKTALCSTVVGGKVVAMMTMKFLHKVTSIASVESATGEERIMFGSDDGKLRELYKGTSFDGGNIEWYMELSEDHFGGPLIDKRYRTGTLEIYGLGYAEFNFSYSLGYGDASKAQPRAESKIAEMGGEYWNSFTWDSFYWDGKSLTPSRFRILGINQNISLVLRGRGDFYSPLKFSGALVQYTPLRSQR